MESLQQIIKCQASTVLIWMMTMRSKDSANLKNRKENWLKLKRSSECSLSRKSAWFSRNKCSSSEWKKSWDDKKKRRLKLKHVSEIVSPSSNKRRRRSLNRRCRLKPLILNNTTTLLLTTSLQSCRRTLLLKTISKCLMHLSPNFWTRSRLLKSWDKCTWTRCHQGLDKYSARSCATKMAWIGSGQSIHFPCQPRANSC